MEKNIYSDVVDDEISDNLKLFYSDREEFEHQEQKHLEEIKEGCDPAWDNLPSIELPHPAEKINGEDDA